MTKATKANLVTDLERAEQTLWCVEATRDDQCADDPGPPSDDLIQYWKDRVADIKSIVRNDPQRPDVIVKVFQLDGTELMSVRCRIVVVESHRTVQACKNGRITTLTAETPFTPDIDQ